MQIVKNEEFGKKGRLMRELLQSFPNMTGTELQKRAGALGVSISQPYACSVVVKFREETNHPLAKKSKKSLKGGLESQAVPQLLIQRTEGVPFAAQSESCVAKMGEPVEPVEVETVMPAVREPVAPVEVEAVMPVVKSKEIAPLTTMYKWEPTLPTLVAAQEYVVKVGGRDKAEFMLGAYVTPGLVDPLSMLDLVELSDIADKVECVKHLREMVEASKEYVRVCGDMAKARISLEGLKQLKW